MLPRQQPPGVAASLSEGKFPLTLIWPQKEVAHDVVCAATTSEERSNWVKALNKTLKALREQAPTSGWLTKQGGRARTGILKALSTNKRRWFCL